jgi:dephospho-CoA kinase
MLQVGLTGSIASGKSHASSVFAELGAHVIDADVIAHEICVPGTPTYAKIVEAFGNGVLAGDGTIDRRVLGEIIFHNAEKRQVLNSLVHPEVRAEVMRRMFALERQGFQGIIIVDAALIVESGFYKMQDRLIVVICEPELQVTRVMNRCGITVGEAHARITAQLPVEEKVKLADYVIDTSGTYGNTREQIERIYRELILLAQDRRNKETRGD